MLCYTETMWGYIITPPKSPTQFYPFENVINVYQNLQGDPIALEDDHRNRFTIVTCEELGTYTREGKPMEVNIVRATSTHYMRPMETQKLSRMSRDGVSQHRKIYFFLLHEIYGSPKIE